MEINYPPNSTLSVALLLCIDEQLTNTQQVLPVCGQVNNPCNTKHTHTHNIWAVSYTHLYRIEHVTHERAKTIKNTLQLLDGRSENRGFQKEMGEAEQSTHSSNPVTRWDSH